MRVRVMIPARRRNRDTVVVFGYPTPTVCSSVVALNIELMRKILIKTRTITFACFVI